MCLRSVCRTQNEARRWHVLYTVVVVVVQIAEIVCANALTTRSTYIVQKLPISTRAHSLYDGLSMLCIPYIFIKFHSIRRVYSVVCSVYVLRSCFTLPDVFIESFRFVPFSPSSFFRGKFETFGAMSHRQSSSHTGIVLLCAVHMQHTRTEESRVETGNYAYWFFSFSFSLSLVVEWLWLLFLLLLLTHCCIVSTSRVSTVHNATAVQHPKRTIFRLGSGSFDSIDCVTSFEFICFPISTQSKWMAVGRTTEQTERKDCAPAHRSELSFNRFNGNGDGTRCATTITTIDAMVWQWQWHSDDGVANETILSKFFCFVLNGKSCST